MIPVDRLPVALACDLGDQDVEGCLGCWGWGGLP